MLAEVLIPESRLGTLTYLVPDHCCSLIAVGVAVRVPLQNRIVLGYIFRLLDAPVVQPQYALKAVESVVENQSFFDQDIVELLDWLSHYYVVPLSSVLRQILPWGAKNLKSFKDGWMPPLAENSLWTPPQWSVLNPEQEVVKNNILRQPGKTHLIDGITASGKSEIYLHLIEAIRQEGKGAILLVPEIALTYQLARRLQDRFKDEVDIVHSALTPKQRRDAWIRIRQRKNGVVVGTRSAIFSPVQNLGLIILDEEHDSAYKQESTPRYHARSVAFKRAMLTHSTLILSSATPQVTTLFQSQQHAVVHTLKTRYNNQPEPKIDIIDRRQFEKSNAKMLTMPLVMAIKEALDQKDQVMLLFNQRGLHRMVRCVDCGEPVYCPHCSVTLTVHENDQLLCHHCGAKGEMPLVCASCGSSKLKKSGKGIQSLETEVKKTFPYARIGRLDRDVVQSKDRGFQTYEAFGLNQIDILIGTQMIAKGHHFPGVSLVGIVDADQALFFPDIFSTEQTYDLLVQVSGRAGRGQKEGHVLIQTYHPHHYVIESVVKGDRQLFYKEEMKLRKMAGFPPFRRMARISVDAKEDSKAQKEIDKIEQMLRQLRPDPVLYPASQALIHRIGGRYRWNLLLAWDPPVDVSNMKQQLLAYVQRSISGIRVNIDIDPVTTI